MGDLLHLPPAKMDLFGLSRGEVANRTQRKGNLGMWGVLGARDPQGLQGLDISYLYSFNKHIDYYSVNCPI